MRFRFLLTLICLTVFFSMEIISCKKENEGVIPNAAVDIYIYTNNPSFFNLNAIGGYVYVTGGVRGLIVYRKTNSDFAAYDRNCTYQPASACATISVDNTGIVAKDSCCGSRFSIYDGSILQGPAGAPLKAYNTTFDGNVLHIYN